MDDTVGPVRDATAEALGTLLKVIGERPLNPYIEQLDKIKMDKVICLFLFSLSGFPGVKQPRILILPLDGIPVHHKVTPSFPDNLLVPFYTPGWGETLWGGGQHIF